jgi:hypothetical protein
MKIIDIIYEIVNVTATVMFILFILISCAVLDVLWH